VRTTLLLLLATFVAGCSSNAAAGKDTKYPPRAEGCAVQTFHETPGVMSENIGPVTATCGADVSDADCMRTLLDQVCKLGGDIVWGVTDGNLQGKKQLSGRAAHTKTAGK
jgi:hypothetical protein